MQRAHADSPMLHATQMSLFQVSTFEPLSSLSVLNRNVSLGHTIGVSSIALSMRRLCSHSQRGHDGGDERQRQRVARVLSRWPASG